MDNGDAISWRPPSSRTSHSKRSSEFTTGSITGKARLFLKVGNKSNKKFGVSIIIGLPLLAVGLLSSISIYEAVKQRSHTVILMDEMRIAQKLRQLIHLLQKERASSCNFISTHPDERNYIKLFKILLSDRMSVNRMAETIENEPEAWPHEDGYRTAKQFRETLTKEREKVDEQSVDCIETMEWFHVAVEIFVGQIVYEFEHVGEGRLWGEINAFAAWILAKEELGMTRALGSKLFSTGHLSVEEYAHYQHWSSGTAGQLGTKFYILAGGDMFGQIWTFSSLYVSELDGAANALFKYSGMSFDKVVKMEKEFKSSNRELITNISLLQQEILRNNLSNGSLEKSLLWLEDMSAYSELLSLAEEEISVSLLSELEGRHLEYTLEMILTLMIVFLCLVVCPLFSLYYVLHARYTKKLGEKTKQLAKEEKKMSNLLYQLLPSSIAQQILDGKSVTPESYKSATVFFSDIMGFTALAAQSTPLEVVYLLNQLYIQFDAVLDMHDCYKVETIGDAFLVVSGLPKMNEPQHSSEMAAVALEILCVISKFEVKHMLDQKLLIRIGIHTGGVVAGVVGSKRPSYCLFGDTVNTASRMESTSAGMRCQVSEATRDHLRVNHPEFECQLRGDQIIKGKGKMTTYWLISQQGYSYKVDLEEAERLVDKAIYFNKVTMKGQAEIESMAGSSDAIMTTSNTMPGQIYDIDLDDDGQSSVACLDFYRN